MLFTSTVKPILKRNPFVRCPLFARLLFCHWVSKRSEVKISSRCLKQVSALEVVITFNRWCCCENNNNKKQLREWKQVIRRTDLIIWVLNAQGNVTTLPYFTHHTSDNTKHEMQTCANMKYILTGSHLLFLLITPQGGHASIKKHWQMTKTTRRCFCLKLKPITIKLSTVLTLSNRLHAWI